MTAPIWGVAFVCAVPVAWLADRYPSHRPLILSVDLLCGCVLFGVCTGVLAYVPRYVLLCFINGTIWAGSPVAIAHAGATLASESPEIRAISMSIMTGVAQLAVIYGSVLFPAEDAPAYYTAFGTFTGLFFFGGAVTILGSVLARRYPHKSTNEARRLEA